MFWATIIVGALFLGWVYNVAVFGDREGTRSSNYQVNLVLMVLSGLLFGTLLVLQLV